MESVHRSVISYTGYKVTTYSTNVHKRVALAISNRNDGLATTVAAFHQELGLSPLPQKVLKRLGNT